MLFLCLFSLLAILLHTSIRSIFAHTLRLRLELESHHFTLHGRAARLFLKHTVQVSLALKTARIFFLICWTLSLFLIFRNDHFLPEQNRVAIPLFVIGGALFLFVLADTLVANLSRIQPYSLLRVLAPFFLLTYFFFWPVSMLLFKVRQTLFRDSGPAMEPNETIESRSEDFEELVSSLQEVNATEETEPEVKILQNALEFRDVRAGSCMIPRSEVVAVEINSPVESLIRKFTATRLTRILIYRESIENIIGYVHSFEMFRKPVSIISVIRPVVVVPETIPVKDLLTLFIRQRRNMAVVVDEYGGTSGVLTIEDVIEELFGEIDDEHDQDHLLEKKLNEKEYLFSARLEIAYLNEKYGFHLPESRDYTTLGGFMFHLGQGVPRQKQKLFYHNIRLEAFEVGNNRVETVKLILK
ncbi:MAG TPA: hemolysin family protein [Bacteroidia bacterium]|jgi:putative hemolysin|nr:hemolysin family protein [Bacteroidia bacterium]